MLGEVASCPVLVCERSSITLLKGQEGEEDLNHRGHVAAVGHDEFTCIRDKRTREEMHLLPRFCVPVRLAPTAECAAGETHLHKCVRTCLKLLGVHGKCLALSLAFPFCIGAAVGGVAVSDAILTSCGDKRNVPILAAAFGGSGCSAAID